jgi:hypothetical protein
MSSVTSCISEDDEVRLDREYLVTNQTDLSVKIESIELPPYESRKFLEGTMILQKDNLQFDLKAPEIVLRSPILFYELNGYYGLMMRN